MADDTPVVMALIIEEAIKTKYKEDVDKSAIKECANLINFKIWKYLKSAQDAKPSVHTEVTPCGMIVKDKRSVRRWKTDRVEVAHH